MVAPRPRSWSTVPPPVTESPRASFSAYDRLNEDIGAHDARDELLDEDVSDEDWNATPAAVSVAPVPSVGHAAPSEDELPELPRRKTGKRVFAAIVASAAALVVASIGWSQFARLGKAPVAGVAARVPERRAPERVPEPPTPAPAPAETAPATNEAVTTPAALDVPVEASPEKAAATVAVTIKTVPEGAVIFRARERLGSGVVEVNVPRNAKQRFTALLDGYTPSNFTLDGSRDSITIRLKRAPKRQAAPPPESDAQPGVEPTAASNAATAAAPTAAPEPTAAPAATVLAAPTAAAAPAAAPATESTPPAAPGPDVSRPVASPEPK